MAIAAAHAAAQPRPNLWVAYAASGANNNSAGPVNGTTYVTAGDLRWRVFAIRTRGARRLTAQIVTPAGFDSYHLRARDIPRFPGSLEPHSRAEEREQELRDALTHFRPPVAISLDRRDRVRTGSSPELDRHESCGRSVMRESIEAQIRTAANPDHRRRHEEDLDDARIAQRLAPPVDSAALLLRLISLRLPDDAAALVAMRRLEEGLGADDRPTQWRWRSRQAGNRGRSVGRTIDLRVVRDTEQARLCRSLAYNSLRQLRTDTCRVEAVIDRRDGWPITIGIVREGRGTNGATEMQFRSFNRLAPLEGFVAPANPCAH